MRELGYAGCWESVCCLISATLVPNSCPPFIHDSGIDYEGYISPSAWKRAELYHAEFLAKDNWADSGEGTVHCKPTAIRG